MMRAGHHALALPFAVGYGVASVELGGLWGIAAPGLAFGVWLSSTWPDLDHPRFKGRGWHFPAAVVRASGHLGYLLRTEKDKVREDVHRGPSHCLEWCVLVGALLAGLLIYAGAPWDVAAWVGGSVTLGTATHVLGDVLTPSGVPVSALYSWIRHGEPWRRYSLGLFATDSAGERFGAIPLFRAITGVLVLGVTGLLGPVLTALTGVSF